MEELLQVVLERSSCEQQFVLKGVVVQHSKKLQQTQELQHRCIYLALSTKTAFNYTVSSFFYWIYVIYVNVSLLPAISKKKKLYRKNFCSVLKVR